VRATPGRPLSFLPPVRSLALAVVRAMGSVAVVTIAAMLAMPATAMARPDAAHRPSARAGSYTGQQTQSGNPLHFWVAPGSRRIVNIAIPGVILTCVGSGGFNDAFGIASATIGRGGGFHATATRTGITSALQPVSFSYSLSGHVRRGVASGSWREDARITDATGQTCTTNRQTWKATLDPQPRPTNAVVPGGYRGTQTQSGNPLTFNVSPARTLQEITIPGVILQCVGSGGFNDQFHIAGAPIRANGSFAAQGTQTGVENGLAVTFTYIFTGNFEGRNAAGQPRAAGLLREDAVVAGGQRCSSNTQTWSATLAP
jgi:hypothetical protein